MDREIITCFIERYKYHSCLWDVSNPDYMNKSKRINALQDIVPILGESATIDTVRKKIDVLRNGYYREHKKVNASLSAGTSADNVYRPTLWYWMSFLSSQEASRPGIDDLADPVLKINIALYVHRQKKQKKEPKKKHKCYKNYSGPSTAMESTIILEGFKCSIAMHNLIYGRIISDGDSGTYIQLLTCRPYSDITVEKIECRNHLLRNFCNKLTALQTDTKFILNHRKVITQKKNNDPEKNCSTNYKGI
ncbi:hypothetical protein ACJJTC_018954 [Scirpophaga incertulas]